MPVAITSDVDLFADEAILDPWPLHRELRDMAPAVYLARHDIWAIPRYADARAALKDWGSFTSRLGVCVGAEFNQFFGDSLLTADPPRHTELSKVFRERLSPGALREVTAGIEARADSTVAELVGRGEFDGVADLADRFPVEVVADLVGLPPDGREELRPRAAAAFNIFGPENDRARQSMSAMGEIREYMATRNQRDQLTPGSFGVALYEAAERGELPDDDVLQLIQAYLIAGMDTTVNAIGSVLWLLAENPDQWELLREDPTLARGAFDEALRLESPVMGFARTLVSDQVIDGVEIAEGGRILPLLGSANRDERRWENPEAFDITRDNSGHLAFGFGLHACTGRALAHIEGQAVLKSLVRQVETLRAGPVTRRINNQIRGLETLPLTVEPA